jgi:hypothetical protein
MDTKDIIPTGTVSLIDTRRKGWGRYEAKLEGGEFVAVSRAIYGNDHEFAFISMGDGTFFIGNLYFEIVFPFPDHAIEHEYLLCRVTKKESPLCTMFR